MPESNRHDAAPRRVPDTWPDWTDDDRWEPGPHISEGERDDGRDAHPSVDDDPGMDAAEAAYGAEQERRHAADPTDEEIDRLTDRQIDELAGEAEARDRLERGLCF